MSGLQDGTSTLYTFLLNLTLKPNEDKIFLISLLEIDVPIVGKINIIKSETVADGFYKLEEKTKAKRVPFRWTMSDFNGEIMISGTEKILKYNSNIATFGGPAASSSLGSSPSSSAPRCMN